MTTNAFTDIAEGLIIDHVFRTTVWAKPASLYLGLMSAVTNGETSTFTELSGGSYARVQKTPGATDFNIVGNVATNAGYVTFPNPTGAQGTATHIGIWDASVNGNLLVYSQLNAPVTIAAGGPPLAFAPNAFSFTYNGKTTAFSNLIVSFLFGSATWAKPTSLNFDLMTTAPTAAGGGVVCNAASYAAVNVACSDSNFAAPSSGNGTTSNANNITFPVPGEAWGEILAARIVDNTGLFITWAEFAPQSIGLGYNAPYIAAGAATWSIN